MELLLAIAVGTLYATGIYQMMQKSTVRLVFGLILISHAANLLIFTIGGLRLNSNPILPDIDQGLALFQSTDPLPQALILTAIVISFGVLAFTLVLILRTYEIVGTSDVDKIKSTDQ